MRAVALAAVFVPAVALAQQPLGPPAPPAVVAPAPAAAAPAAEPSECVTTTTVRCTGAAAPYAVQPAPPPTVVVTPPPPPVAAPPPPAPAPAPILLDPRLLNGWKLVQTPEGCLFRERKISTDAPGVWGTGLAVWLTSYFAGAIGGQVGENPLGWWPVIGAFVTSSFTSGGPQVLWAIDGVAQAGGFVTFLVGLAAGPDKVERLPLTVGPMAVAGAGSGIALAGHF